MASIGMVETSLRDGNQSLWGATGIDTATTLAIAPVMDRVGFEAIDFTTSTHMGVAVRDHVRRRWQVLHLFNPCGKAESEISVQPLEQFYEVSLFAYDALVATPGYALQAAMRETFMNPATTRALHKPAYNLIAHPFNTRFQNSNQWILEMLALSLDRSGTLRDSPHPR